jgi:hypothetical protein
MFDDQPDRRSAANLLTKGMAVNFAQSGGTVRMSSDGHL